MAEQLRVRLRETNEEMMIDELVPTESALLYKSISDEIWQNGRVADLSYAARNAVIPPNQAQSLLNEVISEINPTLVFTGNDAGPLTLSGRSLDEAETFQPKDLREPISVNLNTLVWDENRGSRVVELGGHEYIAEILDEKYIDYYRELNINMIYRDRRPGKGGYAMNIEYGIQRSQKTQNSPSHLYVSAGYGGFAETGYEGQSLGRSDLTIEQEKKFLRVLQYVGGIAVDSSGK